MAESDAGRRATGTVSTEEAERLSERFRPSWEDDPPTVPREPLAPRADPPAPAPVVAAPAARGPAGDDLDWEVPTNPVPEAPPVAAPVGTVTEKLPAVAPPAPPPPAEPPLGAQTLKLPAAAPAPPRDPPPTEDADAFQIDVEELPPESKPSGIGEKYVPKEDGAPPVVLNDDVRAAELGAQAALEAQHRARRAPTMARIKVVELPTAPDTAEPNLPPPKSSLGWLLALGVIVALVAGAVVVVFGGSKPSAKPTEPVGPVAATVAPDTAAPLPPALPTESAALAAAPPEPTASAAAPAEPTPPSSAGTRAEAPPPPVEPPAKPASATKSPAATPSAKTTSAPKASPPAKTAAPAPAKPASKPPGAASKPSGGKAVIVRDSPF